MGLRSLNGMKRRLQAGIGELDRVLSDPFLGDALDRQVFAQLEFALLAVVFDLADLFDHACTK
ncbi:hypothetical protein D3C72_2281070 [compost metagenome]